MRLSTLMMSACVICGFGAVLHGADWGEFSGTLLLKGTPPQPVVVQPNKDTEYCGRFDIVDESFVVGSDGGIQNIVVFMYVRGGAPPIHPDFANTAADKVTLENRGCRFNPHVVTLRTSQTLLITNPDTVGHNSKIDSIANGSINPLIPPGAEIEHQFANPEPLAALVSCSIHSWMSAKVIVKDHPYMAVTDEHGKFSMKNVPEGKWMFRFWHEKAGYVQDVEIGGKPQKWARGVVEVDISAGKNDLGVVHVPPTVFK